MGGKFVTVLSLRSGYVYFMIVVQIFLSVLRHFDRQRQCLLSIKSTILQYCQLVLEKS